MRAETPRSAERARIVRELFEAGWNEGRFSDIDRHLSPNTPFHYNGRTVHVDPGDLPSTVERWRTAFPDLKMEVHELVAADDLVAVRLELTGTHLGAWNDLPASGSRVRVAEMMMFRFEGERVTEMWETFDDQGLRDQIEAGRSDT